MGLKRISAPYPWGGVDRAETGRHPWGLPAGSVSPMHPWRRRWCGAIATLMSVAGDPWGAPRPAPLPAPFGSSDRPPLLRVHEPRFLASADPENEWRNGCGSCVAVGRPAVRAGESWEPLAPAPMPADPLAALLDPAAARPSGRLRPRLIGRDHPLRRLPCRSLRLWLVWV